MMKNQINSKPFIEKTDCPFCGKETSVQLPANYAQVFDVCDNCGKTFILERLAQGFQIFTREDVPYGSDPECREIEMGGANEP